MFPYSVIPGGARNSRELSVAARREPVVAAHYAGFSVAHTRVIRLPYDKLAYVSYRLGNHIYWTKTKVTLHQGETLLSDGEHLARTRCGNRISDVAMTPVSPQEPPQKLLSTPFEPAHVNVRPAFRTDGPIWPENAATPVLMAMRDMAARLVPVQAFRRFFRFSAAVANHHPQRHPIRCHNLAIHRRFRDNSGARGFPSAPLGPGAFAFFDSLAAHFTDLTAGSPPVFAALSPSACRDILPFP